jgi:hypothetical protein
MTSEEFDRQLEQAINLINQNRRDEVLRISLDLKALVQLRIQTDGDNATGSKFAPYTSKYAKYGRRDLGYQDQYFDFTRTGQAFANIRPQVTEDTDTSTTVTVSGTNQDTIDKLAGQVKKRGNILTPSDEELDIAREANRRRIQKYIPK